MIADTAEILKKVRKIEVRTTRLVNDLFGGEYQSVFKGQGIEFAEVREYVPGDDIRSIDWNVTARSDKAYIKKFVEERELTVIFALDMSGSLFFGSQEKLKSEIAAEVTSLLAFSAVKNNDKTGLVIGTEEIEKFIPVKKGRNHVLRVVREILGYIPIKRKTSLKNTIDFLNQVLNRSAVVFLISDFLSDDYEKSLRILNRKHDVIALQIKDPIEDELPSAGLVEWTDHETGKTIMVDTSSKSVRDQYRDDALLRQAKIETLFKSLGIDKVTIPTTGSYVEPLFKFFKQRSARR